MGNLFDKCSTESDDPSSSMMYATIIVNDYLDHICPKCQKFTFHNDKPKHLFNCSNKFKIAVYKKNQLNTWI